MRLCDFCDKEMDYKNAHVWDFYYTCKFHNHLKKYCPIKRFINVDHAPRKLKKFINKNYKRKWIE